MVKYSRREMLQMLAAGGVSLVLSACGKTAPTPGSTAAAVAPTTAPTAAPTTGPSPVASATHAPATAGRPTVAPTHAPVIETRAPPPTATPGPWLPPVETRITANEQFYTLKYHPGPPPAVDQAAFRLVIEGEVDNPLSLSLDQIKAFPAVTEMRTLQCISNPAGGNLIGNAVWTGVSLALLLQEAGLRSGGRHLKLESADGYHTGIPIELALDPHSLLVYEMNGETLPADHGFPLRALWPGRYGQKQPKWLERITVQPVPHTGHWEGQGWSDEARVQPTSIIEQPPNREGVPGEFYIGGVAFTTDGGLEKVDASVDGGNTWLPAELLRGPDSLAWAHWWLRVEGLSPGVYRVLARATDNLGKAQTLPGRGILDGAFPNGTDEMHQIVAQVRAAGS